MIALEVRAGRWADSAKMMRAAREAQALAGVERAFVFMGTPANVAEARELGLGDDGLDAAGPNDLVIAIDGAEPHAGLEAAAMALDAGTLASSGAHEEQSAATSLTRASADVAIVSVPGEYASLEAHKALGAGMDVLLFSNGVGVDDEVALKVRAHRLGRLVMGPGAGTAVIEGVGLGFANAVASGPVGVVAAAGTGAQEVTVLLERFGSGITQCYGTGGRDLQERIGARTALDAIGRLAADDATEVILCVSKPPAPAVAETVVSALAECGKPAVACFVGGDARAVGPVRLVPTLDEAARAAAEAAGAPAPPLPEPPGARPRSGVVRGLFSGGTLCSEAAAILAERLGRVVSNAPAGSATALDPGEPLSGHACLDLGEEEYTRGRPHPMIDPHARAEQIAAQADDSALAVLLFDVVLGFGSHPDPAGVLIDALQPVRRERPEVAVIAHVLGTEADSQVLSAQEAALQAAGVTTAASNALAARWAAAALA